MTSEWAATLLAAGKPSSLVLSYDRYSGEEAFTLGELASLPAGSYHESFHFTLNNYLAGDNRIPPYGMRYDEAKRRNVLPVPEDQYGAPGPGGTYNYWDQLDLDTLKPDGAVSAQISLLYQGTSWEYIQFLEEASNGSDPAEGGNAFLGAEGEKMLEAWMNADIPVAMEVAGDRKMVPPVVMASAHWETDIRSYTIGGTVTGLAGSGLVLQNNDADDLSVVSDGDFVFATALTDGSDYAISILTQPQNPDQSCVLFNASGQVSGANISNIKVNCASDGLIFSDGFE
jgi:hypothetical protein